jgi:hypothetical protein
VGCRPVSELQAAAAVRELQCTTVLEGLDCFFIFYFGPNCFFFSV